MRGETTINIPGLIVAPGFIDIHNHSTTVLENNLAAVPQVTQGITTLVVGLDGEGPYEVEGFMARFDEAPPAVNIVAYTGHSTIRRQVMGSNFARAATADEVNQMEDLVEMGMREGAFGLSTSLAAGASSSASVSEIISLSRVVARYGGSLACELRNYGDDVVAAVKEVVEIARQAKIPMQISHLNLKSSATAGKGAQIPRKSTKRARKESILQPTLTAIPKHRALSCQKKTFATSFAIHGFLWQVTGELKIPILEAQGHFLGSFPNSLQRKRFLRWNPLSVRCRLFLPRVSE